MHKRSYYIVNAITIYRLASAPFLAILAIVQQPVPFRWLLAISFFTDAIDGHLSRRYNVTSVLGAKLDSVADDFTIIAAVIGLLAFKPEFVRQELMLIGILLGLLILQTALALIRYGKITSFHSYLAKMAAIMQGIFMLLMFFLPETPYAIFYAAYVITGMDLMEEIILVLILPDWQANVKGIYWIIKARNQKNNRRLGGTDDNQ